MALTTMKELLVTAQKEKYAVGAFEFWSLDSAQAIIHAAETENVPVILQAGKIECDFCDGVKYLAQIAQIAAADAKVRSLCIWTTPPITILSARLSMLGSLP